MPWFFGWFQFKPWPDLIPKKLELTHNLWKGHVFTTPKRSPSRLARILGLLPFDPFLGPNTVIGAADGHQIVFFDRETWAFPPKSLVILDDFLGCLDLGIPFLMKFSQWNQQFWGWSWNPFFFLVPVHVFFSPQRRSESPKFKHWSSRRSLGLPFDRRNPPKTSWKKSSLSRIFAGFYVLSLATKIWTIHSTLQGIQVSLNLAQPGFQAQVLVVNLLCHVPAGNQQIQPCVFHLGLAMTCYVNISW